MVEDNAKKLTELGDLFEFILKVQKKLATEVVSREEVSQGEGRKGVLMVRGGDKWVRVFEVVDGRLVPSNSVDGARTVITFESVDSLCNLCKELLAGNLSAFLRARARGEVRVVGDYAVRDVAIFNRLFSRAGQVLNNYGVKVGGE